VTSSAERFDIVICGGGLIGASLASALAPLDLAVAVIEAVPPDAAHHTSFDERSIALANGSRRIFETLGLWPQMAVEATPIKSIHISDMGRFGFARVNADELALPAVGYVLATRALGRVLWGALADRPHIVSFVPAQVTRAEPDAEGVTLEIERGSEQRRIRASLVVAADGAHSSLREQFGVALDTAEYRQSAVVTTVLPQKFHAHTAFERFTPSGPLAVLPYVNGRCAVVLTLSNADAAAAAAWSDAEFLAELQRRFGFRLGRFLEVGRRTLYPLALKKARTTSAGRCVVIGNAAQTLHPIAGMGFNLGLRDVACLAETIADRKAAGATNFGARELLDAYDRWRAADRRGLIDFTDGLVRLFGSPLGLVARLRDLGLLLFDAAPPAKVGLAWLSTGVAARMPKLARGVSLI
jgi:2-octaprenyl-6-methoxyphenol hydroxylase